MALLRMLALSINSRGCFAAWEAKVVRALGTFEFYSYYVYVLCF